MFDKKKAFCTSFSMQQFVSKKDCKIIFRAIWILLWGLHFISLTNALHEITPCKEFEMELELTKSFLTKQFNGVVLLHFLPQKLYRNGCHMVDMIYDFHAGMQAIASQSPFRIHSREKKRPHIRWMSQHTCSVQTAPIHQPHSIYRHSLLTPATTMNVCIYTNISLSIY